MTRPLYTDVDFGLLRTLHALIEERSVTGAARRLGISQPAVSRALQKLRSHFGDPLLVRKLGGMVPTPRADELMEPLRRWLSEGEALFRPKMEEPGQMRRVFRIASTDYGIISVIGPALATIAEGAPNVGIAVAPLTPDATEKLAHGELDLIITGFEPDPSLVHSRYLFSDRFTCLVRDDHPVLARADITLEDFMAWPHIVFTVMDQDTLPPDPKAAALTRRVVLWTQNTGVIPLLAGQSDAIALLPKRAAAICTTAQGLTEFDPPFVNEAFGYWLVWHERNRRDPAISWLTDQFAARATTGGHAG